MRHPQQNGNGGTANGSTPIDAEVVQDAGTTSGNGNACPAPITGQAYPMQRHMMQPGQMVIPQKVVFGIGGFVLGAGVMYWLLRSMKDKR